ncbi:resolvase [Clostridia bacterium]|nr:resolvase [Clostridia bacterium]GHV08951.1 resolvase [Clostridia bacterium]
MKITRIEASAPPTPKRKRVAAYARVSSAKDAQLQSLSAQISYYSKLIQSRADWEYCGVYADDITGTKDNRAEFRRLLAECKAGNLDMVITKSISRFARNTITLLDEVRNLKQMGVDVYFERENIHTDSGDGELMLTVLASFAQAESLSVSENCKWRIRKRFAEGEPVNWRHLYGYKIVKGNVEIDHEQAKIVRMIFTEYLGGMGCHAIAKKLRDTGVPSHHGGTWSHSRVSALLKTEKFTGNCTLQKKFTANHLTKKQQRNLGELPQFLAEDTHPAIIDIAAFGRVQTLMAKRAERFNKGSKTTGMYPFSGKVVCENCGKHYRRKVINGKHFWQCGTFLEHGRDVCPAKRIPENVLEDLVAELGDIDSITEIRVPQANHLTFVMKNGEIIHKTWQDRSRSESWTDEMKAAARQKTIERNAENAKSE